MRHMLILSVLALASCLSQAAEPRPFNDHRALNADAKLSVRNVAGLIDVQVWDRNEFDLAATLAQGVDKVEISGTAADLKVEVKRRKSGRFENYDATRLTLRVPAGVTLTLDGTSADLVVHGLKGALVARTVSGDVQLDIASTSINAQSVSGDLRVNAPAATDVKLSTVSGDANVHGVSGKLVGDSVSGNVRVEGGPFSQLELKSVSGDVEIHASTLPDARVKAESLSGDVRFNAPASLSAELSLKTFSGEKHCDFDGASSVSEGKRTVLRVGDGHGEVNLTSFSGDVTVEKR